MIDPSVKSVDEDADVFIYEYDLLSASSNNIFPQFRGEPISSPLFATSDYTDYAYGFLNKASGRFQLSLFRRVTTAECSGSHGIYNPGCYYSGLELYLTGTGAYASAPALSDFVATGQYGQLIVGFAEYSEALGNNLARTYGDRLDARIDPVPEPSTWLTFPLALIGLGLTRWKGTRR